MRPVPTAPNPKGVIGAKLVDDAVQVRLRSCSESAAIQDFRLIADVGEIGNIEPTLWHVRNDGSGGQPTIFTLGVAPAGFDEVVPLTDPLTSADGYIVQVDFRERGDLVLRFGFDPDELEHERWRIGGPEHVSDAEFATRSIDCSRG